MTFEIVKTEPIYQGRVFDVRRDIVTMPGGREAHFDIVVHRGAVTLVPVDDQGQIWFIHQYRHAARTEILELPAGVMEVGEPPEVAARREIREEIGMAAGDLHLLGEFYLAPGYSTEYMYVYLAENLHSDPLEGDEDELIRIEKIPVAKAMQLAETGQIQDAKSLAALLLARAQLAGFHQG